MLVAILSSAVVHRNLSQILGSADSYPKSFTQPQSRDAHLAFAWDLA